MSFYHLPILIQWLLAVILCIVGFYSLNWIDSLWKLPLLFIALPVLQFCCTPLFRLLRIYKTLSPTVFTIFPSNKKYELHNITTFDYLQTFSWSDKGKIAQKKLLLNYGKAFLYLIEQIESNKMPATVLIVGHSYFFSERTTRNLFSLKKDFFLPRFLKINKYFLFCHLRESTVFLTYCKIYNLLFSKTPNKTPIFYPIYPIKND